MVSRAYLSRPPLGLSSGWSAGRTGEVPAVSGCNPYPRRTELYIFRRSCVTFEVSPLTIPMTWSAQRCSAARRSSV